jgi:hypothetical protein
MPAGQKIIVLFIFLTELCVLSNNNLTPLLLSYENVAAVTGLPLAEMPAGCSPSQENGRSLSAPAV